MCGLVSFVWMCVGLRLQQILSTHFGVVFLCNVMCVYCVGGVLGFGLNTELVLVVTRCVRELVIDICLVFGLDMFICEGNRTETEKKYWHGWHFFCLICIVQINSKLVHIV